MAMEFTIIIVPERPSPFVPPGHAVRVWYMVSRPDDSFS